MTVVIEKQGSGLTIGSDSMESIETVTFSIQVATGARNETTDVSGMSHFLEHMAFKGTKTRTALQIAEEFDAIGGHINAYTSRERTVYYAKVLRENSRLAVDILSDILIHSTYQEEEIEKEREVILQEIAQTNDTPDDIIFDNFQEVAYPEQSFGRSILGPIANIKRFSQSDILNYVKNNHFNENIIFTASGRIEHAEFSALVNEFYTEFSHKPAKFNEPAQYRGGDFRQEKDLEQVHIVFGFAGVHYLDADFYTYQILSLILGGGMSSRLFQEIREKRGLVYHVSSFSSSYSDTGIFGVYGATTPENGNIFLELAVVEMVKALDSITEDELQRAKSQVRASMLMSLESSVSRAEKLAFNIKAYNRYVPKEEILQKINAIQLSDLKRVLDNMLKSVPTLASIGKVDKLISYEKFCNSIK